jgi:hypothetical protein
MDGFYWRSSTYQAERGRCAPCDLTCKTCYGSGPSNCSQLVSGNNFKDFGNPFNSTFACEGNCTECSISPTNCTRCTVTNDIDFGEYLYSVNTSSCIQNIVSFDEGVPYCTQILQYSNNSKSCEQCNMNYFWDFNTSSCVPSTEISKCLVSKRDFFTRDIECLSCSGGTPEQPMAFNKDSKTCEFYDPAQNANCEYGEMRSLRFYCLKCNSGYRIDVETGWCASSAKPHQGSAIFNGIDIWMELPPGCILGYFSVPLEYDFYCQTCNEVTFTKYDPADQYCLNLQCNNPYFGVNKLCKGDGTDPIGMNCDPNICIPRTAPYVDGSGKFYLFELAYVNDTIALRIKPNLDFFLGFEMLPFTVYQTISSKESKVFCNLISDNLSDDQTICHYKDGVLFLEALTERHRQILGSTSSSVITLKKSAFKITRKLIVDPDVLGKDISREGVNFLDAPAQNLDYVLDITFNSGTSKNSNWIIDYQPQVIYTEGIQLRIVAREPKLNYQTYKWSCLWVGAGDTYLRGVLQTALDTFDNSSVNIQLTNTSLIGLDVVFRVVIFDEFNQEHTTIFKTTVVSGSRALLPLSGTVVHYTDSIDGVFIPLFPTVQNINPNLITISSQGLTGTLNSQIIQKPNHFVLQLRVTNGNDFNVTVGFSTYVSVQFKMVKIRARTPSTIAHEAQADNINPFTFMLLNSGSSFKVFCADESNMVPCLTTSLTSTYTQRTHVSLQEPFNVTSPKNLKIFFLTSIGNDESVASAHVSALTTSQLVKPRVTSRKVVMYPESPFYKANEEFYLDFRQSNVSSVTGVSESYTDQNLLVQSATVAYTIDPGNYQLNQPSYIPATKMASRVTFTLNDTATEYDLIESRIISSTVTSTISLTSAISSGYLQVDVVAVDAAKDTCNEPVQQFVNQFILAKKFIIGDFGNGFRIRLMPGLFTTYTTSISSRALTHCGPVLSNEATLSDTSGASFSSSLSTYVNGLLSSLGSTNRDLLNALNLIMMQINHGFSICVRNSTCLAPQADWITQADTVIAYLPVVYDNSRYTMTSRYSFINGFLLEPGLASDANIKKMLTAVNSTVQYIRGKIRPILLANHRFSHELSLGISQQEVIQADLVDYPISVASNLLSTFLFGYQNNTDRNDMLNSSIINIVSQKELKMLRVSSNKREEVYEDSIMKVQGTTVLTDLSAYYEFNLNNDTKLVFKNLKFEVPTQYYDIIIVNWKPKLIEDMWPYYNATTNGFINRTFYFDFRSYFQSNIPIEGEGQILSKNCTFEDTTNCSNTTITDYTLCYCFNVNVTTAVPPVTDRLPPGVSNPTPGNTTTTNQTNTTTGGGSTGGSTGGTGGGVIPVPTPKDFCEVFDNSNKDKLNLLTFNNFSVWCFSTLAIEFCLTSLYIVCVIFWKKLDKRSGNFCQEVTTKIKIHQMLAAECATAAALGPFNDMRNSPRSSTDKDRNSSSSGSDNDSHSRVKRKLQEDPDVDMSLVDKCGIKELKWYQLYSMYLKLSHMCSSLTCLKSGQYSKVTLLTVTYLRMIAHLALSMYLTLGKLSITKVPEMKTTQPHKSGYSR